MGTDNLVIIGNGFDKAHGYKTGYDNFIADVQDGALSEFQKIIKPFLTSNRKNISWYEFEDAIREGTLELFRDYFAECYIEGKRDKEEYYLDTFKKVNILFDKIKELLMMYLEKCTSENKKRKIYSIEQVFRTDVSVINFNYTNVAERYCNNIYYIHGSIEERYIILGHKMRPDEPDATPPEAKRFEKDKARERLRFYRWLKSEKTYLSDKDIQDNMEKMIVQTDYRYSLRGEYELEDRDLLTPEILEYVKCYPEYGNLDYGVNLQEINELVIIGHSIFADDDVFYDILNRANNISKISLFTFDGEKREDLQKKENFFQTYYEGKKEINIEIDKY